MRILLFLLAFFILVFLGGLLSVCFYEDTIESYLVGAAQKALKEKGYDDVKLSSNHLFLMVQDQGPESASLADIIDKEVKGAYPLIPEGDRIPMAWANAVYEAEVNLSVADNGSVILSGLVPSEKIKERYGAAIGDTEVDNQLVVGDSVIEPKWLSQLPGFLSRYLSFPGVSSFKADTKGFTLNGKVATAEVKDKISLEAQRELARFGPIQNQLSVRKLRAPSLKIHKSGTNGYEVSGWLPRGGLKDALLYTVLKSIPGKHVKDKMEIDSDVSPPWWAENAKKLIPEFFKNANQDGTLEFSENELHLKSSIEDPPLYERLVNIASPGKPENFRIIQGRLDEGAGMGPSLSMFRGRDRIIKLEGNLATEKEKEKITKALAPLGDIDSKIETGGNVGVSPWTKPERLFAAILKSSERVSAGLFTDKIILAGRATSEQAMKSFEELAAKVMGSASAVETKVRMVTPETIAKEDKMEDGFKETAVYFKTGSAAIEEAELSKIKLTAQNIIETGTKSPLIVGGYADLRGDKDQNRMLSLKRANSVRDRLIELGVAAGRMEVRHFGEDVSNVAQNDLWKSRRVELSLGE